jgi:hypothetical protein
MNIATERLLVGIIENNYMECKNAIKEGAEVEPFFNEDGENILHVLIERRDNKNIVQLILNNSAININTAKKDSGDTPIIIAARNNRMDIVELLKRRGADIFKKNKNGISAYDIISKKEKDNLHFGGINIELLIENIKEKEKIDNNEEVYKIILGIIFQRKTSILIGNAFAILEEDQRKDTIKQVIFENKEGWELLKKIYQNKEQ